MVGRVVMGPLLAQYLALEGEVQDYLPWGLMLRLLEAVVVVREVILRRSYRDARGEMAALVVVEVGGLVDQVLELKGLEDPLFLLLNGRELKWQKK